MFTGIIQAKGVVDSCHDHNRSRRLCIEIPDIPEPIPELGDSLAVSGMCLTVVKVDHCKFSFDVSSETLARCLVGQWAPGHVVNIEKALTLSTPLGGHLVSGHVDGIGKIVDIQDTGAYRQVQFSIESQLGMFIAHKGSLAVDGVSLTINQLADRQDTTLFDLMLVPHTLRQTTLGHLSIGEHVHIEVDQIARYVQRLGQYLNDKNSEPNGPVENRHV